MSNRNSNTFYVERGDDGKYRGSRGDAERASYVEDTQKEVVDKIEAAFPGVPIHIERVRDTSKGERDKWRS